MYYNRSGVVKTTTSRGVIECRMIMKMIAHAILVNGIAIIGMRNIVALSVGGKMVEKNHRGAMIVTRGIFSG